MFMTELYFGYKCQLKVVTTWSQKKSRHNLIL